MSFAGYRHPRTMNEMKQYFASIENELDVPVKIRGSRQAQYLPHAWDDIYRSNIDLRCWKAYRKTQWKAQLSITL